MAKDAKVRVRLDTRKAKGDLRQLTKDASQAGRKISSLGKRGMALGGLGGLGAGLAGGFAAARAQAGAGFGDLASEFFRPFGVGVRKGISDLTGGADIKAAAEAQSRQLIKQQFGFATGVTGDIPPEAQPIFRAHAEKLAIPLRGARQIDESPLFGGVAGADTVGKSMAQAAMNTGARAGAEMFLWAKSLVPEWLK